MRTSLKLLLPVGTLNMQQLIQSTQPANLSGYWSLGEPSGTVADDSSLTNADGAYAGTVTLAQPGIGDGTKSTLFGGGRVSLAANLAALNTAFNPLAGTLFMWGKVTNVGVWTDSTARMLLEVGADANNRVFIQRTATNGQLQWSHRAGGTAKNVTLATASPLTFMALAISWDKNADQVIAYFNGVQTGATQTGLGVWTGSLASGFTALADFSSAGSAPWAGWGAHAALYKVALSATEIARLSPAEFLAA